MTKKPILAMVAGVLTPYRINLHKRVAEELPEFEIHTLITHGAADFDWKMDIPSEINVSFFAQGGDAAGKGLFATPLKDWKKGKRLINYFSDKDIAGVVFHGYSFFSQLRLLNYCHKQGIPAFLRNDSNIHGDKFNSKRKQFFKKGFYRWALPRCKGIMHMGEFGRQYFEKYGVKPEQMYFVPCIPDYQEYATVQPENLNDFRARYGLKADRRYLLYSGRLIKLKRLDLLIDAFNQIANERPNWDILMVGDGSEADVLKEQVSDSLKDRVLWTGFLQGNEIISAYHASDAFVLTSEREAWGVVIQEALAAGLPVIASDIVGAANELVEEGVNGTIFETNSLASLKEALLEITAEGTITRIQESTQSSFERIIGKIDCIGEIRRALRDVGKL